MCLISIIMWVRRLRQMGLNFADHCCRVNEMQRENKFIRYTQKHIHRKTHSHTYAYVYIHLCIYTCTYTYIYRHIYT